MGQLGDGMQLSGVWRLVHAEWMDRRLYPQEDVVLEPDENGRVNFVQGKMPTSPSNEDNLIRILRTHERAGLCALKTAGTVGVEHGHTMWVIANASDHLQTYPRSKRPIEIDGLVQYRLGLTDNVGKLDHRRWSPAHFELYENAIIVTMAPQAGVPRSVERSAGVHSDEAS